MQKIKTIFFLAFFSVIGCIMPLVPVISQEANNVVPPVQSDEFARGKVLEVVKEETKKEYGQILITQKLRVMLQGGKEKGKEVTIFYDADLTQVGLAPLAVGDKIIVGKSTTPDTVYYVNDRYRLIVIFVIGLIFFGVIILLAGTHGLRAFFGLLLSFAVIGYGIIPFILNGSNPFLVCLLGAAAIACTSLYIAHGIRARTTIAFVSIVFTIALAFLIGYLSIQAAHLFGLGSEEAFYLQFVPMAKINLRWLLLGGIIIGTLGVLDDVTTAQAAAVEEIHLANATLSFKELYIRGLSVGREHIISLVNTLILAYTGASLPLLLLFKVYERPIWVTVNSEIIAEEIIRMLVGSLALVVAVPLTTLLAAYFFSTLPKKVNKVSG